MLKVGVIGRAAGVVREQHRGPGMGVDLPAVRESLADILPAILVSAGRDLPQRIDHN